jgi:hypothetical protein
LAAEGPPRRTFNQTSNIKIDLTDVLFDETRGTARINHGGFVNLTNLIGFISKGGRRFPETVEAGMY